MPIFRDGAKSTSLLTVIYIIVMMLLIAVVCVEFIQLQNSASSLALMKQIEVYSRPAS